jgi:hypothetical protein
LLFIAATISTSTSSTAAATAAVISPSTASAASAVEPRGGAVGGRDSADGGRGGDGGGRGASGGGSGGGGASGASGSSGGEGGGGIIDGFSGTAEEKEWSYANDVGDDDVHESDVEIGFSIEESDDVNLLHGSAEKEKITLKRTVGKRKARTLSELPVK